MNYFTKDKPYNTLTEYYKKTYGMKIAKVSLNVGFTCPNRDGKKAYGGCTFCSASGSGDFAGDRKKSLKEQFSDIKKVMDNKWKGTKYIAYLQANTNTYAPTERLREIYLEALSASSDIVGLDIATRADCITEEVVSLLHELQKMTHIEVELGLESSNEDTSLRINRHTTNQEFINAVSLLRQYGIETVVHIINGLPGETEKEMLDTIDFVNSLDIQGIKFHSLLILRNTPLYEEYLKAPFHVMSLEEYVGITVKQICNLRDDIIIHRLAADGPEGEVYLPEWPKKKLVVMNEIDKMMRKEHLYQGMNYNKKPMK